jgi:hypothetical protein
MILSDDKCIKGKKRKKRKKEWKIITTIITLPENKNC